MTSTVPARPTRRALARGVAWSVPTVAVASIAPAYAASVIPCPTLPGLEKWTRTTSGSLTSKNEIAQGGTLQLQTDAAGGKSGTVTYTTQISVVAGVTYGLLFAMQTAKGYSGSCTTKSSSLVIKATMPAGAQTLGTFTTQGSTGTKITPPNDCTTTNAGTWQFGAGGVADSVYDFTTNLTVPNSGTASLSLTFTLDATSNEDNDDWKVSPMFTTCSR